MYIVCCPHPPRNLASSLALEAERGGELENGTLVLAAQAELAQLEGHDELSFLFLDGVLETLIQDIAECETGWAGRKRWRVHDTASTGREQGGSDVVANGGATDGRGNHNLLDGLPSLFGEDFSGERTDVS